MNLLQLRERIEKCKKIWTYSPGSVNNIFQIYENEGKDYQGNALLYTIIKSN